MEKEQVKKFDLEAAFKALEEIEIPQAEKGIAANRVNLRERFSHKSATETLVEDYYDVSSTEELEEAQDERDAEVAQAKLARIEKIVDLDAESPDDLLPSYVGKVIMQCPQCMTLFYKNPEDIEHDEENPDIVNLNEPCQHCGNTSGYTLIGKVGAVTEEEADNFTTDIESDLDLDFGEPTEEVDAAGTGEAAEEMSDEDLADIDLELEEIPEEETAEEEEEEEKKEESLNLSKETVSEHETEHKSENLTLNEETTDESLNNSEIQKEAEEGSELKTENESENLTLNEEGNAAWKALSNEPKGNYKKVKDDPKWIASSKYILYGTDASGKVLVEKEINNESNKISEVKAARDELLNSDEKITDVFVSRFYTHEDSGEKLEVELDSYTVSKDIEESLSEEIKEETAEEAKVCEKCGKEICECGEQKPEALTEDLDKELDAKLKAHNDYIEYLRNTISAEEEALKTAENEEIKAAIERRLDAFKADLEAALPEAVKNADIIAEEPKEETVEEVSEEEIGGEKLEGLEESVEEEPKEEKEELPEVEFTTSEVKEVAEEVAEKMIDNIETKGLNIDTEEWKEDATEVVVEKVEEKIEAEEGTAEEPVEEAKESLTEDVEEEAPAEDAEEVAEEETVASEKEEVLEILEDKLDIETTETENGETLVVAEKGQTDNPDAPKVEVEITEEEKEILEPELQEETVEEEAIEAEEEKVEETTEETKEEPVDEDLNSSLTNLFNSPEFKKPITDAEVEKYLNEPKLESIEEFQEESFDRHVTDFLHEVYSNVDNFATTRCDIKDGKLIVEGCIKFNSGKEKLTVFEFLPNYGEGSLFLEGINKDFSDDTAFKVDCTVMNNAIITESLEYKFKINETLVEGLK